MTAQRWIPCELHTHTVHSDGRHTLPEMVQSAVKLGLEFLALTDHNTISGHQECQRVTEETGIEILRGLEWTTFYGHMLVLGLDAYADWRDLGPDDIHKGIERVRSRGAVVGIAHPFRVGTPLCTGCYWEFNVKDWSDINYIEVWNGSFPCIRRDNARAFAWWTELLNQGHRLPATSGRDWHGPDATEQPLAVTYVKIEENPNLCLQQQVINAIRNGRISVTMGPLLLCSVKQVTNSREFSIGDTVPLSESANEIEVQVKTDFTSRMGKWSLEEQQLTLVVSSNLGDVVKAVLSTDQDAFSHLFSAERLTWLRAELYGVIHGVRTLLAFTSPIYFKTEQQE